MLMPGVASCEVFEQVFYIIKIRWVLIKIKINRGSWWTVVSIFVSSSLGIIPKKLILSLAKAVFCHNATQVVCGHGANLRRGIFHI